VSRARLILEAIFGSPGELYFKTGAGEHVVGAAVRDPLTGDIYLGSDHTECTLAAKEAGSEALGRDQYAPGEPHLEYGFFTSTDRFISRQEALVMAREAHQLKVAQREPQRGFGLPSEFLRRRASE
jgi:hypothetical protein